MSDGFTETPHRSKKDTKSWCRGKRDVPHQLETMVEKPRFAGRPVKRPCAWKVWFLYPHGATARYWCSHIRRCTECGRKFPFRDECPDKDPWSPEHVGEWPCAECGHRADGHGTYDSPCVGDCECTRFWTYPRGEAER